MRRLIQSIFACICAVFVMQLLLPGLGASHAGQPSLKLDKKEYFVGDSIQATVSGISDQMLNDRAFIAVYKANARHEEYMYFSYPESSAETLSIEVKLDPGQYEMRMYKKDAEYNDHTLAAKVPFNVKYSPEVLKAIEAGPKIALDKNHYTADEEISVDASGISPQMINNNSYVAIHKAGASHSDYLNYAYPTTAISTLTLNAPNTDGDYEIRLYKQDGDYSDDNLVLSIPFTVTGGADTPIHEPQNEDITQLLVGDWVFGDLPGAVEDISIDSFTTTSPYVGGYRFGEDGTYVYFYGGAGRTASGVGRITAQYTIEGGRIFLTNVVGSWRDDNNPAKSYTDRSFEDGDKFFRIIDQDDAPALVIEKSLFMLDNPNQVYAKRSTE